MSIKLNKITSLLLTTTAIFTLGFNIFNTSSAKAAEDPRWVQDGFVQSGQGLSDLTTIRYNNTLVQSVRGTDNGVYVRRTYLDSTSIGDWTGWYANGKTLGKPSLIVYNGKLFQSVIGTDGIIYTRFTTDAINWSGWIGDGKTHFDITMTVFNGKLYQAVQGIDGIIYTRNTTNGINWSGWIGNGRTPGFVNMEVFNGKMYQAVKGTDNIVYTRNTSNGIDWSGWIGNGKTIGNSVAIVNFGGELFQAVKGTDSKIYYRRSTNGLDWNGWNHLSLTNSDPKFDVVKRNNQEPVLLNITYRNTENVLESKKFTNDEWSDSYTAGGEMIGTPSYYGIFGNTTLRGEIFSVRSSDDNIIRTKRLAFD